MSIIVKLKMKEKNTFQTSSQEQARLPTGTLEYISAKLPAQEQTGQCEGLQTQEWS